MKFSCLPKTGVRLWLGHRQLILVWDDQHQLTEAQRSAVERQSNKYDHLLFAYDRDPIKCVSRQEMKCINGNKIEEGPNEDVQWTKGRYNAVKKDDIMTFVDA